MGDGTVKYPGYKTGGVIKPKGMKNKRKAKMRKIKEAEIREKMARKRAREEREAEYSSEWQDFNREG
jgi:hypothetical protein